MPRLDIKEGRLRGANSKLSKINDAFNLIVKKLNANRFSYKKEFV
jgi:hypothetical protein